MTRYQPNYSYPMSPPRRHGSRLVRWGLVVALATVLALVLAHFHGVIR